MKIICEMWESKGEDCIVEARKIREEQDRAYEDSPMADRQKKQARVRRLYTIELHSSFLTG